jgi:hypothetical protein
MGRSSNRTTSTPRLLLPTSDLPDSFCALKERSHVKSVLPGCTEPCDTLSHRSSRPATGFTKSNSIIEVSRGNTKSEPGQRNRGPVRQTGCIWDRSLRLWNDHLAATPQGHYGLTRLCRSARKSGSHHSLFRAGTNEVSHFRSVTGTAFLADRLNQYLRKSGFSNLAS